MAGAGAKLFTSGSILTAAEVNTYLMDQTIMKFASTTTRDAAFGGAGEPTLAEGMFAYTTDTNTLWLYDGSNWVNVLGSDIGNQALSNRNVIINGAMQVAQRGTSTASITAGNYYTADRWTSNIITQGTWTNSIEADAPTGSGFRNSLKMLCTTADASPAAGDVVRMDQYIEGQNLQQFLKGTASAKQFSVSFWVKANVTGTYILLLIDADNSRSVSASYTISTSATWEKKTITFPADTTGAFDNDNAVSLRCIWLLGAGSNFTSGTLNTVWGTDVLANRAVGQTNLASATSNYWQITGVQLEVGSVATPFEFEDIGDTTAKCQRYYYRSTGGSVYQFFGGGLAVSTTVLYLIFNHLVSMRANPTSVEFSTLNITDNVTIDNAVSAVSQNQQNRNLSSLAMTTTGLTVGKFYNCYSNNSSNGYIAVSAEL